MIINVQNFDCLNSQCLCGVLNLKPVEFQSLFLNWQLSYTVTDPRMWLYDSGSCSLDNQRGGGLDICLCPGTIVCELLSWFEGWLSVTLTGLEGAAGFSAGFRNSRFPRRIWLSEFVFTTYDLSDNFSRQVSIFQVWFFYIGATLISCPISISG